MFVDEDAEFWSTFRKIQQSRTLAQDKVHFSIGMENSSHSASASSLDGRHFHTPTTWPVMLSITAVAVGPPVSFM